MDSKYPWTVVVLPSVQRGDKDNFVTLLQDIVALSLQLPICVIHEHQNSRSAFRMNFQCQRLVSSADKTYTVLFSMKSSSRSFSKLSLSQ